MRSRFRFPDGLSQLGNQHRGAEAGSVTAEFAMLLPAMLLLAIPVISAVSWQSQQLKLWQAAAVVVRAASHSELEPEHWASQLVSGASAKLEYQNDMVCATVQSKAAIAWMPHPLARLCTRLGGL